MIGPGPGGNFLRRITLPVNCAVEALLKFHGADWMGMIFGLISTYLLTKGRRWGFVFGVIAGIGWIAFGVLTNSVPSIIANSLFIVINCRGFGRWKRNGGAAVAQSGQNEE